MGTSRGMKEGAFLCSLFFLCSCETAVYPAPRPNLSWAPSFHLFGGRHRHGLGESNAACQDDVKDDLQHAQLAFSTLLEIAAERESVGALPEDVIEVRAVDLGGVEIPDNITLESIKEMVRLLYYERQRLSQRALTSILQRVAPLLEADPNVVRLPSDRRVVVVGDLHGSLADLVKIFDLMDWPGPENKFIFNGDFVDRGDRGVEIIATLFSLKIVFPEHVVLNRGNHEDVKIGRVYGFFDEVMGKYGSRTLYHQICDVFALLPLCAIIDRTAFVVHGGVPRHRATSLASISQISRKHFRTTVKAAWDGRGPGGSCVPEVPWSTAARSLTIIEDLLWSDPANPETEPGSERCNEPNVLRGAGTRYGTTMAREWLVRSSVKMMVRSHQCVDKGWEEIKCGKDSSIWTVFSSSNYDGVGNLAAVLVFDGSKHRRLARGTVSKSLKNPRVVVFSAANGLRCLAPRSRQRLVDLICRKKGALRAELLRVSGKREKIRDAEWSNALQRVLDISVNLRPLRQELVGPAHSACGGGGAAALVDVEEFLARYQAEIVFPSGPSVPVCEDGLGLEDLFQRRRELGTVFHLLDANHDREISREEVAACCVLLNRRLAANRHVDPQRVFRAICQGQHDLGAVSIEKFCDFWGRVDLTQYQL